jgi:hypothetical protein
VFASPRRLHLRLLFTYESSVKEALDIWPELPIAILACKFGPWEPRVQILVTNIITALKQHDRVRDIHLVGYPKTLSKLFSAMIKPFPSLINLTIITDPNSEAMLPDSFLVDLHHVSRNREATLVHPELCLSSLFSPSPFRTRVHFTRGDGQWPVCIDEAEIT